MIVKYNPEFVFNTVEKYLRDIGALKKDSTRDDLRELIDSLGADDAMVLVFESGESYRTPNSKDYGYWPTENVIDG